MAGPDLDTLSGLMDEAKCFALVRVIGAKPVAAVRFALPRWRLV